MNKFDELCENILSEGLGNAAKKLRSLLTKKLRSNGIKVRILPKGYVENQTELKIESKLTKANLQKVRDSIEDAGFVHNKDSSDTAYFEISSGNISATFDFSNKNFIIITIQDNTPVHGNQFWENEDNKP
jgi:hypothetical protein